MLKRIFAVVLLTASLIVMAPAAGSVKPQASFLHLDSGRPIVMVPSTSDLTPGSTIAIKVYIDKVSSADVTFDVSQSGSLFSSMDSTGTVAAGDLCTTIYATVAANASGIGAITVSNGSGSVSLSFAVISAKK